MVRHVSNKVHIDDEDDVDGGGSTAAVGSTNTSLEGRAQDASTVEDSTRGRLKLNFN